MNFLYVGIAGFMGALLRVEIGNILYAFYPKLLFPYPTLLINIAGSFLLAYFVVSVEKKLFIISPEMKLAISTGLLGSFTTFSTFSVETFLLFQEKAYLLMIVYISLSFLGGFSFAWLGMRSAIKHVEKATPAKFRGNES